MTLMCKYLTLVFSIGKRLGSEARCRLSMDSVYDSVFRMRLVTIETIQLHVS